MTETILPIATQLAIAHENGYMHARALPTGDVAALRRFIYTTGLCIGFTEDSYRVRYCYESWDEAMRALQVWDGSGYPSGNWIVRKGAFLPDLRNPSYFKGIPVRVEP